jgi:hypothetical protein
MRHNGAVRPSIRRAIAGLCVAAAVVAAQSASAAGRILVTVVGAHYWEVGIANSASHRVAANGRYVDCTSAPIADLGVVVHLESTPAGAPYSIVLIGPPVAGRTLVTQEGDFNGKGGNVSPVFLTLGFPKLRAIGVSDFPPGTYRFVMKISHKVALSQTISIVKSGGC